MSIRFSVKVNGIDKIDERLSRFASKSEIFLANEVLKDTDPFVPALTGSLARRARTEGNMVIYPGPYARYLYYGKAMVDSATGEGPMKIVDENGNLIFRFRKGAVLKATEKDLVYTKQMHPNAQSHWFEASKAQNLQKWIKGVKKLARR